MPLIEGTPTEAYDYALSNVKFCEQYGFVFNDTIEGLIDGVTAQIRA